MENGAVMVRLRMMMHTDNGVNDDDDDDGDVVLKMSFLSNIPCIYNTIYSTTCQGGFNVLM